jgi:hypothetical protein
MLTTSELDQIRADIETLLPDTCDILSLTRTSDNAGGWSEAWGTATASVSCRFDFRNGRENVDNAELTPYSGAVLSLPYDTTITTENRVYFSSVTYAVTSVNVNQSKIGVKRATLERVP